MNQGNFFSAEGQGETIHREVLDSLPLCMGTLCPAAKYICYNLAIPKFKEEAEAEAFIRSWHNKTGLGMAGILPPAKPDDRSRRDYYVYEAGNRSHDPNKKFHPQGDPELAAIRK